MSELDQNHKGDSDLKQSYKHNYVKSIKITSSEPKSKKNFGSEGHGVIFILRIQYRKVGVQAEQVWMLRYQKQSGQGHRSTGLSLLHRFPSLTQ